MISVGDDAPDFELPTNLLTEAGKPGRTIKLSDFRGKRAVVLAFYPLDFSPVCSGEMTCLRDDLEKLRGADAEVIGVSVDSAWTHAAFARSLGLEFPLAADFHPKGEVARRYGVYEEGRGISGRATVIVDRAGKVAFAENHGIPNARSDEAILSALAKLATLDFSPRLARQREKTPPCTVSPPATRLVRTSSTARSAPGGRARSGGRTTRPSRATWRSRSSPSAARR